MSNYANIAIDTIEKEIKSLEYMLSKFNENNFNNIIDLLITSKGRLIVTGMGKSGHIGKKIAATLASTGTPSFFMHPAEGLHGDLGMLTRDDVLLAISNSGESEEIIKLIPILKKMNTTLISMAGNINSTLAKHSEYVLDISIKEEACPLGLAPMASTTVTLVMGDALASALMVAKNFKPENFALFHPGGSLGRKLLTKVKDIMHTNNLPIVKENDTFSNVIQTITKGKLGIAIVVDDKNNLIGIITDGDLRRALESTDKIRFELKAKDMMTKNPKTISPDKMAVDAENYMIENKINELVVVDDNKIVGIVQLFDTGRIN